MAQKGTPQSSNSHRTITPPPNSTRVDEAEKHKDNINERSSLVTTDQSNEDRRTSLRAFPEDSHRQWSRRWSFLNSARMTPEEIDENRRIDFQKSILFVSGLIVVHRVRLTMLTMIDHWTHHWTIPICVDKRVRRHSDRCRVATVPANRSHVVTRLIGLYRNEIDRSKVLGNDLWPSELTDQLDEPLTKISFERWNLFFVFEKCSDEERMFDEKRRISESKDRPS